ncbi:tyrosine-type recombinase/integrase [Candidatus Endomicrobiellum devescovinae]|jgi:integrase|uniref:tyrosine-type recombinase/integrase n=1 Tax=Candidatus Endomicrobiellum devescovinae TaxID=3242322 RepID=UPI002829F2AA|nr:site-specific integrase [Endomicrobium sp.]
MAYLAKKGKRYYICESYQVSKLDNKGLPIKDVDGKIIQKNKVKWTPSSKNKKLAEIELGKYEEDKDRGRIGLDKHHTSWSDIKTKYLTYSQSKKVKNNTDATCKRKFTTLKNLGTKLVEWDITQVNPLQKLKINKVNREKEIKYWHTKEEINKVIEKTSGVWRTVNYIGFFIGARLSEILNIKWTDVNFENNKIRIQSSGTFHTKSRKFRIIPMPENLKEYLSNLKKEQSKNDKIKTENIIVYIDGSIPTTESASSYLRKKYKQLGFKGYHAHCLRHTFAAHYLKKYKDIYGLSKILGHHSVVVTEQYYGHLVPNYFDKTMPKFNPLI